MEAKELVKLEINELENTVHRKETAVRTELYKCLFLFTLTNSAETKTRHEQIYRKHATEKNKASCLSHRLLSPKCNSKQKRST